MRTTKGFALIASMLILVAALYRVIPGRPWGFAPHIAMALFAGAVVRDRKWAFALPVFSMFVSDLLYQFLYRQGLSVVPGFYEGQVTNYLLFAGLVVVGFFMKKLSVANIVLFSLLESVLFFVASNFLVWLNGGGLERPKTFSGLLQCYADAIPFFGNSVAATLVFGTIFFGAYAVYRRKPSLATA